MSPIAVAVFLFAVLILYVLVTGRSEQTWSALKGEWSPSSSGTTPSPSVSSTNPGAQNPSGGGLLRAATPL